MYSPISVAFSKALLSVDLVGSYGSGSGGGGVGPGHETAKNTAMTDSDRLDFIMKYKVLNRSFIGTAMY